MGHERVLTEWDSVLFGKIVSLRTITRQTEQESVRGIVSQVHAGVVEGRRLADSMARATCADCPRMNAENCSGVVVCSSMACL